MKVKTYTPKPDDIQREWFVIDAKDQTLGRLATQIATLLRGKHKPIFAPHVDVGDFVIVINAEKIRVTGKKLDQKMYYRHSQYPGGLKQRTLRELLDMFPDRVIEKAVKGMLPKNKLGRKMIKKLKVYAGETHPHQAQKPKVFELKQG
ncbi:MAG: 50S ribosomal protein L13 [Anaerolineae bacterium]|nr:50S ribosomal protein L13 [Anaerolineae bacterium]